MAKGRKLIQGIDTVILRVSNVEQSKEWFSNKIGFVSLFEDAQMKLLLLDTNGPTSLTLWQTDDVATAKRKTATFPIFKTTNAVALRTELLYRGVAASDLTEDDHVKYFQFHDIDGNVLEACEVK